MSTVTEEIITRAAAQASVELGDSAGRVADLVQGSLPEVEDEGYTRDDIAYELDAALTEVGVTFSTDQMWEMAAVVCNLI
ncbi:hypothetical protein [Nonomuraea sp. NPDC049141]|uniref:hypothetical protein n=1 Tax=Nonomuraea sp. NPDC049141 TaxID=3155500 RepID=UPI0033EC91BE